MLGGRRSDNGALFVTETAPPNPVWVGGVVVGELGGIYVTASLPPQVFANGFGLRHTGELCIAYGGATANYAMGLPFTADGRLVCQLNVAPWFGDTFVGGIRVGPLGGVYVVDLTPPSTEAFSSGYSPGYS